MIQWVLYRDRVLIFQDEAFNRLRTGRREKGQIGGEGAGNGLI